MACVGLHIVLSELCLWGCFFLVGCDFLLIKRLKSTFLMCFYFRYFNSDLGY